MLGRNEEGARGAGPWISIKRKRRAERPLGLRASWIAGLRVAAVSIVFVGNWKISIRRGYSSRTIWSKAWDSGWAAGCRSGHLIACDMLRLKPGDRFRIPESPRKEGEK